MRSYNVFNRTVNDMLQAKTIMTQLAMLCLEPNVSIS
ncbi:hypothetical protein U732_4023 [Clostridium argentinense CDC 2741]|uniref:Uncharacterized protein n=1 Tax=Clostridium argentinense CDC 2741 TaxID=1418104 RepID=A0A0C1R3T1_9CLOT|nr:hypothetical protein U732_4023 [Clostridium argentinense CDC 2741]